MFICHCGDDHFNYIMPLTNCLRSENITYWIDDENILIGDNLIAKIDIGLSKSKYAIICIGSDFNNNEFAKHELYYALYKTIISKKRYILPLILNDEGVNNWNRFELLRPYIYAKWSEGLPALMDQLHLILHK